MKTRDEQLEVLKSARDKSVNEDIFDMFFKFMGVELLFCVFVIVVIGLVGCFL